MQEIENLMMKNNRDYIVVFLSEINPQKLLKFEEVDAWI
jgi:diphthamide biosynthesis enzyme Dph1/Dph2-like protein